VTLLPPPPRSNRSASHVPPSTSRPKAGGPPLFPVVAMIAHPVRTDLLSSFSAFFCLPLFPPLLTAHAPQRPAPLFFLPFFSPSGEDTGRENPRFKISRTRVPMSSSPPLSPPFSFSSPPRTQNLREANLPSPFSSFFSVYIDHVKERIWAVARQPLLVFLYSFSFFFLPSSRRASSNEMTWKKEIYYLAPPPLSPSFSPPEAGV